MKRLIVTILITSSFALTAQLPTKAEQAWLFDTNNSELLEDTLEESNKNNTSKHSILKEMIEIETNVLNDYIKGQELQRKYSTSEIEAMKIQASDILKSKTFLGLIPRKTQLIKLSDNSLHYTTREIKVRAHRQKDFENCIWLQNKDGSISYKVELGNIVPIDRIVDLSETPKTFKPVKKIKNLTLLDEDIRLQSELHFHIGLSFPYFTRELVNNSDITGVHNRLDLINYAKWQFPLSLGIALSLQQEKVSFSDGGSLSENSVFIAPVIKSRPFDFGFKNLIATTMVKTSLISQLAESRPQANRNFSFHKLAFNLGLHKENKWYWQNFIYGIDFQRQWVRVTGNNEALSIKDSSITDDAITFKLGLGIDW